MMNLLKCQSCAKFATCTLTDCFEPIVQDAKPTLYCFRLVESGDSVELSRYAIADYTVYSPNQFYCTYEFRKNCIGGGYGKAWANKSQLDRVIQNKLYTFNPSTAAAEERFDAHFKNKLVEARTKLNSAEQQYDLWRGRRDAKQGETSPD